MNGQGHFEEEVDLDLCDRLELDGDRHIVESRECRIKLCEGLTLFLNLTKKRFINIQLM